MSSPALEPAHDQVVIEGADPWLYNEDLAPTAPSQRTWTTYSYAALWIGMAHCVPTYRMAAGLIDKGLNWKQALFTILIGNLIVLVPMLLNSYGGTEFGLPFPVLCRSSFGVRGANIPAILRALVACGWFGIQTWIGGAAINTLVQSAMSVPSWWNSPFLTTLPPSTPLDPAVLANGGAICFLIFWILNVLIIIKGMNAVRWFEGWAAPAVLVVSVVLLAYMVQRAHGFGPILSQPGKFETWGSFLKALPILLTAQVGFWATLSLNMPDFTRFSKNQRSQMLGQALGLPTTMTFFSAIGIFITAATQVVYGEAIWDPTALLGKPEFASPVVVLISLLSIGIATLSVNVAANVVSPAFDFANLWPDKIDFKVGGIITAVIGLLIQPWKLLARPDDYIVTWLVGYSALLGPIAGIMIADFWVLRRKKLHVEDLYRKSGLYKFAGGFNPWAIAALVLGIIPNISGFYLTIQHVDPAAVSGVDAMFLDIYSFAWMIGFAVAFFAYWLFMTMFQKDNVLTDADS